MSLRRREFLAVLGGTLFPFAAHAQEPGRVYHLGIVIPATRESIAGFFDERLSFFSFSLVSFSRALLPGS